jgi:iron complex outermembrane receptor protein
MEGRLEVTQAKQGVWRGASGAQIVSRDFDVHGDEAFLPEQHPPIGVFTQQSFDWARSKLEAGAL